MRDLLKNELDKIIQVKQLHENIEKQLICRMSSHLEEDSNKKDIVDPPIPPPRIPGIMSPYNAKAFNIDVESSSSPSRMSQ